MAYDIGAILFVCAVGTSIISAIVGMSGGVILLTIMTMFFPMSSVIPLHGAVQLFSNGTRSWMLRKHVKREFILPFILGIPFGLAPSIWLIKEFQSEAIPLFLVATLIMYSLFRPKKLPGMKLPPKYFAILGALAAFLCLFVGAVGPFIAPFFIRDDFEKEDLVATKAAMQLFTHLIKIPTFLYLGFPYQDYWMLIALLIVAAWIGTKFGVKLLKSLPQKYFEKLFRIFLLAAGLRLYYKVFLS